MVPIVAFHWTSVEHGVFFTNSSGVLYGQKWWDPALLRIGLNKLDPWRRQDFMELVEAGEFLRWAEEGRIAPEPHGRRGPLLTFGNGSPFSRRWMTPAAPFNLPGFASCLLGSAAAQDSVYLFVRGGAPWFTGSDPNTGPEWEHLRARVVGTLPIPRDFRGALKMASTEKDDVVLLMVTFWVYAWCVDDDLQVVAEGRDVIVQTSHHGEAIVRASDRGRLEVFVASMEESDFPPLEEKNE